MAIGFAMVAFLGGLELMGWLYDHPIVELAIVGMSVATIGAYVRLRRRRLERVWLRLRPPRRPRGPVATSREPIPAGLRFAVLRRDGFRCAYCGRGESDGVKLHIDHLVPVASGGKNEIENLVTACQSCNLGKSASNLVG